MSGIARLRGFVQEMTRLVERTTAEPTLLEEGRERLGRLVGTDDWLPEDFARPDPASYRQYLLWCDPLERFSVVSFVWGPGQRTPVHDHTVWGLIGMLRGAELATNFARDGDRLAKCGEERLTPGAVGAVSPRIGDVHAVANAFDDRASISIHVYGANIGAVARHVFDLVSGTRRPFVSGYSNPMAPNLWDRSTAVREALG